MDSDSASDSISFSPANTATAVWNTIFIAAFAAFFSFAAINIFIRNPQPIQLIVASAIALGSWLGAIFFWRQIAKRSTTISIKGQSLFIKEHLRTKVTFSKVIHGHRVKSVYCHRRFGQGTNYEVWVRFSDGQKDFVLNTWSSKSSAENIRCFIATNLRIEEELDLTNSFL